jgi:hypothetical protein
MTYWRWNADLSSAEIREQVILAAGPNCSLVRVAQRQERRLQPDRRQAKSGDCLSLQNQLRRGERRRYGAQSA